MFEALLTAAMFLARFEPATPAADTAAKAVVLAPAPQQEWAEPEEVSHPEPEAPIKHRNLSPRVRGNSQKPRQENGTFG